MMKTVILSFLRDTLKVFKREFRFAFTDKGALIFIVALPLLYPIIYSLVYNPELVKEVSVVIVDQCHTATTREYARALDATENIRIAGYAANMQEAQRLMNEKKCYAIINFPSEFSHKVGRGEQAVINVYCDMSVFLRYKSVLVSSTAVMQEMSQRKLKQNIAELSSYQGGFNMPVSFKMTPLGNTAMGVASAMLPGILLLIFHQGFILTICLIFATARDRARRNGGIDPLGINTGVLPLMLGKTLCHFLIMILPLIYLIRFVPMIFDFPQNENLIDLFVFVIPFMLGVIFLGFIIQITIREREALFPVFVFTSIIFIFLSGVSWPRYAMSDFWIMVGNLMPSTWVIEGYISMASMGATLSQQSHAYSMLWILAGIYGVIAYVVLRIQRHFNKLYR